MDAITRTARQSCLIGVLWCLNNDIGEIVDGMEMMARLKYVFSGKL